MKRLGIEEGIELNPPLLNLFLKNDAMHDPMVNDLTAKPWLGEQREPGAYERADLQANDVLKKLFDDAWSNSGRLQAGGWPVQR
ncbi:phosphoribosylaminoimidazolesuccinocarboxamide synthase [Escherichia coli]